MTQLIKLFDEQTLLVTLQGDTLELIRECKSVEPIKKLVECHDILRLTHDIQLQYPRFFPELPECDESALLHLGRLTSEIFVYHHPELPQPDFEIYSIGIKKLLWAFRIPRTRFRDARGD